LCHINNEEDNYDGRQNTEDEEKERAKNIQPSHSRPRQHLHRLGHAAIAIGHEEIY